MVLKTERFIGRKKEILFVGSTHSRDSAEIIQIKKVFEDFNPDVVLVEDEFDILEFLDEQDAINKGGDMGFVSFLAKKNGIKIISNDPRFEEDVLFLEKKYSKDLSFLYFFLRNRCHSMKMRRFNKNNTDNEILNYMLKKTNWQGYDYNLGNAERIFKKLFGYDIGYKDYSDFFNPTLKINELNEATRQLNVFRDTYMIKLIKRMLEKNDKLFIIKGVHHLDKTKMEIEKLMQNGQ